MMKDIVKDLIFIYRVTRNLLFHKLGHSYPLVMILWPTYRCNQRCIFCGNYKKHIEKELTTQEILKIINDMKELKIPFCTVSGGEPLLREDIIDIGKFLLKKGIKSSINTNGTLITKSLAEELLRAYEVIVISLDGFEKTHNFIRRDKNGFKLAMRAIRYLNRLKDDNLIGINFVLNKYNYKELLPLTKSLLRKKIIDFMSIQPVNFRKDLNPPLHEVIFIVKQLMRIKRKFPGFIRPTFGFLKKIYQYFSGEKFHCEAGKLYCTIEPNGNLLACDYVGSPIGNLKRQKLKELLKSQKLKEFELEKERCEGCLFECTIEISELANTPLLQLFKRAPEFMKRRYLGIHE